MHKYCYADIILIHLVTELKLKLSEDQNVPRATQIQTYEETSVASKAMEQHGATSSPMSSVEETVETVWKRLKEKRQLLNLPENLKVRV